MMRVIATEGSAVVSDTRHRMIVGAARLLAERGLQETSFSEVLERTGAPRGSIYYHFPEGKDQLIASAVDLAGAHAIGILDRAQGSSAAEVTALFISLWRQVLTASDLRAGCSVLAVTVATDSPELLSHVSTVFRSWRARLAELLEQGGLRSTDAPGFAALLIAATEGAVVLSRAEHSLEPFDLVAAQLDGHVAALAA
jgi:TetR/AcrR family transcriptional repressor of lmrAB and yxaGH operons